MAQHFLLRANSRTLSLKEIFRMTDAEAFDAMKAMRWEDGKPVCPQCGGTTHYFLATRLIWKCAKRGCYKQFSVTSGTIFSSHKLPLQDYLAAIAIFSNSAKGHSALQMSRDLDVQYRTAFVLVHKLREAIINGTDTSPLEGEVELDGSYFGGYTKPANRKEDRKDRRKPVNQNGNKRCVLLLREKDGNRSFAHVIRSENQLDITPIVCDSVSPDALIHADEHSGYDALGKFFATVRVSHSVQYSDASNGACINLCESFFSRMLRCHLGQHHHISPKYLVQYAREMAFREDTRRESNGSIFKMILGRAMQSPVSKEWCGYWQGNHRTWDGLSGVN